MSCACGTESPRPDLQQAAQTIRAQIEQEHLDAAALAQKLIPSPARALPEALGKYWLLERLQMPQAAVRALQELQARHPDLPAWVVRDLFPARAEAGMLPVQRAVLECFGRSCSDPAHFLFLSEMPRFRSFYANWRAAGAGAEEIDRWLAERCPGKEGFWMEERLGFRMEQQTAGSYARELLDAQRANPHDADRLIATLRAFVWTGLSQDATLSKQAGLDNLAWVVASFQPERSTQCAALARWLKQLHRPAEAAVFYRRALALPPTLPELEQWFSGLQRIYSPAEQQGKYAADLREGLAECLQASGGNAQAQHLLAEAAEPQKPPALDGRTALSAPTPMPAGQPAAAQNPPVEDRTLDHAPQYWLDRARIARNRGNATQEGEALRNALAQTRPQSTPARERGKGFRDVREEALLASVQFLRRTKRAQEAVDLLREELRIAPADACSTEAAARELAGQDASPFLRAEDDVPWNWLASRPVWEFTEGMLLRALLEQTPHPAIEPSIPEIPVLPGDGAPQRPQQHAPVAQGNPQAPAAEAPAVERASQLTRDADLSRTLILAAWLQEHNRAREARTLLQEAAARATSPEERRSIAALRLRTALHEGDWKQAREQLPLTGLVREDRSAFLREIAVSAARAGAREEALQMWKEAANPAPWDAMESLRPLADLGLREELLEYFRHLQQELPDSLLPEQARLLLQAP